MTFWQEFISVCGGSSGRYYFRQYGQQAGRVKRIWLAIKQLPNAQYIRSGSPCMRVGNKLILGRWLYD